MDLAIKEIEKEERQAREVFIGKGREGKIKKERVRQEILEKRRY